MSLENPPPGDPANNATASSVDDPAPPRRRPRTALWLSAIGVILVAALTTGGFLWAGAQLDQAESSFAETINDAKLVRDDLQRAINGQQGTVMDAVALLAAETAPLSAPAERDDLDTALVDARTIGAEARAAIARPLPQRPARPFWPWEQLAQADALDERGMALRGEAPELRRHERELDQSDALLGERTQSYLTGIRDSVEAFEKKNLSARNSVIIDMRLARDDLDRAIEAGYMRDTVFALGDLGEQAASVAASHKKVLAGKAGPLLKKRLTVEAWARKISGGVLVDFTWRRIVNGYGQGNSAGGLVTWNAAHGGHAKMTLSNSVAQYWPHARMKALVAHEVGHVISAKCYDMFDWGSRKANEQWATAWALSRGHTADGNGVSLYGYPPKSLISKAKTCR